MPFFARMKNLVFPVNRRLFLKHINELKDQITVLSIQQAMPPDRVWSIGNVQFYAPNFPEDYLQRIVVVSGNFYEIDILTELDRHLPEAPVICDIGANVGNHTLYWLCKANASFCYCFEPRKETFAILEKNIGINSLADKCKCFCLAVAEGDKKMTIDHFNANSIGETSFKEDADGAVTATSLDSVLNGAKVDFLKIDVEGMEHAVIAGASGTLSTHKPLVFVESMDDSFRQTKKQLAAYGYRLVRSFRNGNHLLACR